MSCPGTHDNADMSARGIRNQDMFIGRQNTNSHGSHYTKSELTSYVTISYQRIEKIQKQ